MTAKSEGPSEVELAFLEAMTAHRKHRGWSQVELATRASACGETVMPLSINRFENPYANTGKVRRVNLGEALAITRAFGFNAVEQMLSEPCHTCMGAPPAGFICADCGAETK